MVTSFNETRHHLLAGEFAAAADGIRHFAGLAQAIAHAAAFVADDHQRAEIETASAFDDFGGTVDEHDLLDQFFAAAFVKGILRRIARRTCDGAHGRRRADRVAAATLSWFS